MNLKNLDRIVNLGFTLTINWNRDVTIVYENFDSEDFSIEENIFVLYYVYPPDFTRPFSSALDVIVDEFYSWYSNNRKNLDKWIQTKNESIKNKISPLGDVSNKVNRQLILNDLLNEDYDF